MMLSVEAESSSGEDLGSWSVLNEAVVEKRQSGIPCASLFSSMAARSRRMRQTASSSAHQQAPRRIHSRREGR